MELLLACIAMRGPSWIKADSGLPSGKTHLGGKVVHVYAGESLENFSSTMQDFASSGSGLIPSVLKVAG